MRPSRLVCAGCGAEPERREPYPFRCPNAGHGDDVDHVLRRELDLSTLAFPDDGGDDRRCQGRVAATRDRQVAALAPGQAQPVGRLEPEEHAEEMARLVRTGDVAGLVLDPDATLRR